MASDFASPTDPGARREGVAADGEAKGVRGADPGPWGVPGPLCWAPGDRRPPTASGIPPGVGEAPMGLLLPHRGLLAPPIPTLGPAPLPAPRLAGPPTALPEPGLEPPTAEPLPGLWPEAMGTAAAFAIGVSRLLEAVLSPGLRALPGDEWWMGRAFQRGKPPSEGWVALPTVLPSPPPSAPVSLPVPALGPATLFALAPPLPLPRPAAAADAAGGDWLVTRRLSLVRGVSGLPRPLPDPRPRGDMPSVGPSALPPIPLPRPAPLPLPAPATGPGESKAPPMGEGCESAVNREGEGRCTGGVP